MKQMQASAIPWPLRLEINHQKPKTHENNSSISPLPIPDILFTLMRLFRLGGLLCMAQ